MTLTMCCAWKCCVQLDGAAVVGTFANRVKRTIWNTTASLLPMLFLLAVSCSAFAIDSDAGLPTPPEFTNNKQLESKFKTLTFEALKTQAEQGSPASQAELGRRYLTGEGTPTNALLGVDWTRRAATNGLALAQFDLGRAYENGTGVAKDLSTAVEWYRRAVEQNLPSAAHQLARLTEQRALPEFEPKDSLRLYELAAEQGDLEAAYQLAQLYLHPPEGGEVRGEHAAYWLNCAASGGHLPAYAGMGFYYLGEINRRMNDLDLQEAERWFRLGVARSDPGCEYGLGMLELSRNKTTPDLNEMRMWLTKAASKNYSAAFYQLGRLSELKDIPHGPSVIPDLKEAARWYERGLDLKERRAAFRLVELTLAGKVEPPGGWISLLRRASDLGDMNARFALAIRYQKGEAQPRDDSDSPFALIASAADQGVIGAKLELANLYIAGTNTTQDLVEGMCLLFSAARSSSNAVARIQRLRLAAEKPIESLPASERALQQAFNDYIAAVYTATAEPAATLARRYLDGTYPTNSFRAAVWYSVAKMRRDPQSTVEANRILATLSNSDRTRADGRATLIFLSPRHRLPGF